MTAPSPIPLYVGDDWALAFRWLQNAGGAPVAMAGWQVGARLFYPYGSMPHDLTAGLGRAAVILDDPAVSFALGLERGVTIGLDPDPQGDDPVSRLSIYAIDPVGHLVTIGVFRLHIKHRREIADDALAVRAVTDPVSARQLVFVGLYDGTVPLTGDQVTNFDQDDNALVPALTG